MKDLDPCVYKRLILSPQDQMNLPSPQKILKSTKRYCEKWKITQNRFNKLVLTFFGLQERRLNKPTASSN